MCFFGPLLGGLLAGLAMPVLEDDGQGEVTYSIIDSIVKQQLSNAVYKNDGSRSRFSTECDSDEERPLMYNSEVEFPLDEIKTGIEVSSF